MMRRKWKRVSPRGSRVVDGSKRMIIMAVRWVFILDWPRFFQFWREPIGSFGEQSRASKLVLKGAEFAAKSDWNCLEIFPSEERRKRVQINFNQARRKGKQGKTFK